MMRFVCCWAFGIGSTRIKCVYVFPFHFAFCKHYVTYFCRLLLCLGIAFFGEKYLNDLYNADDLTVNMGTLIFENVMKTKVNISQSLLYLPCMGLHHHKTHCNCIVCDLNCAFHNKQQ